jgi:hypothetical protein
VEDWRVEGWEEKLTVVDERSQWRGLTTRRQWIAARCGFGLALLLGISVAGPMPYAQFPSNDSRNNQRLPDVSGQYGQDSNSPDKKRIQMLNAERQKSLVSDADKLLKLAKELNDEVAENDSAALSSEQLRKVEEIGKLAKSVKSKMSFTVGGYPTLNGPLTIPPGIQ